MAETLATVLAAARPLEVADRLEEAAAACARNGDIKEQIRLLEIVLDARRAVLGPHAPGVAGALDNLARTLCESKQFEAARPLCVQSLSIRQRAGPHHPDLANSLDRLAQVEFGTNNLDRAEALYRRALAIRKKRFGPRHSLTATSLVNLAAIYATRGNYLKAAPILAAALAVMTRSRGGSHPDLLYPLFDLATVYRHLGRFQQACDCADRALSICDANFGRDSDWQADFLSLLSEAYSGLGRYYAAHLAARRALAIRCKQFGRNHPLTASAIAGLAFVQFNIGQCRRAQRMYQRALKIYRRAPGSFPSEIATILHSLGLTYGELGKLDTARALFEQALELHRAASRQREVAATLLDLAIANRGLGEEARAFELYGEAYRVQRKSLGDINPDVAMTLIEIGRHYHRIGRIRSARRHTLKAIAILSACNDPQLMSLAFDALAEILDRQQRSAGIFSRKLAVSIMQGLRRGAVALGSAVERDFVSTHERSYRSLADALILGGRLPEAQQVLLMIKEHEFDALMPRKTARGITRVSLTDLENAWNRKAELLRARIKESIEPPRGGRRSSAIPQQRRAVRDRLKKACATLEKWLQQLIAAFAGADARSSGIGAGTKRARIGSAARTAGPGTALIQYLVKPDHLRIIATASGMQRQYEMSFTEGELNRLVFEMRNALRSPSDDYLNSAQQLYRLLIAPVAADLRKSGAAALTFSLDGVLRYLPLAALHDGTRFLLEEFAIGLAIGAGSRAKRLPAGRSGSQAAGFGVTESIAGHAALPWVRQELSSVIRTKARNDGILSGVIRLNDAFTAHRFRLDLSGRAVIHIASHFVFRAAQEVSSYLLLGDGSKLTLHDLAAFRFDGVDLMVLSACDTATGGGHHHSGREIEGLGALARRQGARNVVATLWPVEDFTTATLMRAFYRNCYELGLAPAEALRSAQLSLLSGEAGSGQGAAERGFMPENEKQSQDIAAISSRHPYHWAPYLLMGENSA